MRFCNCRLPRGAITTEDDIREHAIRDTIATVPITATNAIECAAGTVAVVIMVAWPCSARMRTRGRSTQQLAEPIQPGGTRGNLFSAQQRKIPIATR